MRLFITLAIALLASVAPATATTIAFGDLLTSSAFTAYTESGFTVAAISGNWESNVDFGNPAPFIWFMREADDPETSAQIEITAGGSPFTFTCGRALAQQAPRIARREISLTKKRRVGWLARSFEATRARCLR